MNLLRFFRRHRALFCLFAVFFVGKIKFYWWNEINLLFFWKIMFSCWLWSFFYYFIIALINFDVFIRVNKVIMRKYFNCMIFENLLWTLFTCNIFHLSWFYRYYLWFSWLYDKVIFLNFKVKCLYKLTYTISIKSQSNYSSLQFWQTKYVLLKFFNIFHLK